MQPVLVWLGCVWAVWNQGCPVLEMHRLFSLSLGPGLLASCCYWVLCSPTTPCMARVILPSIKHQASSLNQALDQRVPRRGAPRPQSAAGPQSWSKTLGLGRLAVCRQTTGSHVVFVQSPHRIDTVLTNSTFGFHAPPSRTEPPRRRPSATPQTSTQCDQSLTHSLNPNPPESCPY